MIFFLLIEQRGYRELLDQAPAEVTERATILTYGELFLRTRIPVGNYVFMDLERLSPHDLESAARVWAALEAAPYPVRLFNHPLRAMRRYELLRTLREAGINDFDVFRLTEARRPKRYPVFVRDEHLHAVIDTDLLHDSAELDTAVEGLVSRGVCRDTRIVTEYSGERDEGGLYRKYAAFKMGERIVPIHLQCAEHWIVKGSGKVVNETTAADELEYVRTNPDAALIEQVFSLAQIDYGRIDYGKVGGRMQVYEINTNPRVTGLRTPSDGLRRARSQVVRPRMVDALVAMDSANGAAAGRPAEIALDPPLRGWRGRLAGRVELRLRRLANALDRRR